MLTMLEQLDAFWHAPPEINTLFLSIVGASYIMLQFLIPQKLDYLFM